MDMRLGTLAQDGPLCGGCGATGDGLALCGSGGMHVAGVCVLIRSSERCLKLTEGVPQDLLPAMDQHRTQR